MDAVQPVKKTFKRVSKKKKAALKANKRAIEMGSLSNFEVDVSFLKCPLCGNYFEDPILLGCGHLVCKKPCGINLIENSAMECTECHVKTELDSEQGINSLENLTYFSVVLAKLKSGIDPRLVPELQRLSDSLNGAPLINFTPPKLQPYQLDYLKEIILNQNQNQKSSVHKQHMNRATTVFHGKKVNERFRELMKQRAARLITLPREDREALMDFWSSKGVRFPPPPPCSVMDQLHDKCKKQAKAIEMHEKSKTNVPSLFDIQVTPPVRFGFGQSNCPPQPPPGNGSLLRPTYMYGNQNHKWNVDTEETREEEQWVKEANFGNTEAEFEDYYSASPESDHNGYYKGSTTGHRPFGRPPFGPRNFGGIPPVPRPLMPPPPSLPYRMPFDTRGPRPPRQPTLPFNGPGPHPSEPYNPTHSFGRQHYHDNSSVPSPNFKHQQPSTYDQPPPFHNPWGQSWSGAQQARPPPLEFNRQTMDGQEVDAYNTRRPNLYEQQQPHTAVESQTFSLTTDHAQGFYAPQYHFDPTQTAPAQSQESLVSSDLEVQQRWTQAMVNLQEGTGIAENSLDNIIGSKFESAKVSEGELEQLSVSDSTSNQPVNEVCDGQEVVDEPSFNLYDEFGTPVTTTPHLCVGRLPAIVKPPEVKTLLSKHGKVSSCKLASNKSSTKTTYLAMVTMETVEAAAKCIQALNESYFRGSKILVKKMKNNPTSIR